jgi:hypothetical protein
MNSKYASLFSTMGVFQIGSLKYYKRMELPEAIRDINEGKRVDVFPVRNLTINGKMDNNAILLNKQFGFDVIGEGVCNFVNVSILREHIIDDYFIFSMQCSDQPYYKNFKGYNTCLEIFNIRDFIEVATETLNSVVPVALVAACEVKYRDRKFVAEINNFNVNYPAPYIIKDKNFINDREFRIVWRPINKLNFCEKISVGNSRIVKYLKLM